MITTQARQNILNQQTKYKTRYDSNRSNPFYKVGDTVLVKNIDARHKLDIRYDGPYRILQQLGQKTFVVQHLKSLTKNKQVTVDMILPLFERKYTPTQ
jgi:hypothetical protein